MERLELSKHHGVKIISGITSHPNSKLRELSDIVLDMGIIKESCTFGLKLTARIVIVLTLKEMTREDFRL